MDLATPLLTYGPLGIAVVGMSFVIIRQYKDNKQLQAKYDVDKEARRIEILELTTKPIDTQTKFADTANLIYGKLKASKED